MVWACHESVAFFVLRKLILQTCMHSNPVGLDVWFLVWPFVYFHTSCVRTVKALLRLRGCAGSPEPLLVAYVKSTINSWAGSFNEFIQKCMYRKGPMFWGRSIRANSKNQDQSAPRGAQAEHFLFMVPHSMTNCFSFLWFAICKVTDWKKTNKTMFFGLLFIDWLTILPLNPK